MSGEADEDGHSVAVCCRSEGSRDRQLDVCVGLVLCESHQGGTCASAWLLEPFAHQTEKIAAGGANRWVARFDHVERGARGARSGGRNKPQRLPNPFVLLGSLDGARGSNGLVYERGKASSFIYCRESNRGANGCGARRAGRTKHALTG